MEMSPEFSSDGDRMVQWASTAKLRRIEVERIETLLAEVEISSPGPTLR
jgi:CRISPR/Cas system-associated protein Cas10 (large subunit of type III CRISPR-Cas system)